MGPDYIELPNIEGRIITGRIIRNDAPEEPTPVTFQNDFDLSDIAIPLRQGFADTNSLRADAVFNAEDLDGVMERIYPATATLCYDPGILEYPFQSKDGEARFTTREKCDLYDKFIEWYENQEKEKPQSVTPKNRLKNLLTKGQRKTAL